MTQDKSKICPYCREEISTFARKCRYCGERVGEPLTKELKLTVDDIGRPEESRDVRGETLVGAYQALQAELKEKTERIHKQSKRSFMSLPYVKGTLTTLIVVAVIAGLVAAGIWIVRFARRQSTLLQDAHVVEILKEANDYKMAGNFVEALRTVYTAIEVYPESDRAQAMLNDVRADIRAHMEGLYRDRAYDQVTAYAERALEVEPGNSQVMMMARLAEEDKSRYTLRLVGIVTGGEGNQVAQISTYLQGTKNVAVDDSFMDMRVLHIDDANKLVSLYDNKRGVRLKVGMGGRTFDTGP
jgi:hypothetical protein